MEGVVRVEVHPTESIEKVVKAVQAVMGEIELRESDRGHITVLEGRLEKMEDLLPLRDLLSRMRIRDAAFSLLTGAAVNERLSFGLNKQAAFAGRASFHLSGTSPTGPIQFELAGDIEKIIEYLCGKSERI
ncbi:hypothetical protein H8E65_07310 [Candidatus Bathyarchaeota archaeon]|nr:hypothetical protein [Candidatus Bathyarchaeota archaeon]MBL7079628.1 hypothetical protein [Candidatus Bathyarchaeota archaeon]